MKRYSILFAGLAAGLALSAPARADDSADTKYRSFYIGTAVALSRAESQALGGATSGRIGYEKAASGASLVFGWRPQELVGPAGAVSVEVEFKGFDLGVDKLTQGAVTARSDASMQLGAVMANAVYEVDLGGRIKPYATAGVGVASARLRDAKGLGLVDSVNSKDVFAWQAGAGLAVELGESRRTVLNLGYNRFTSASPRFPTATDTVRLSRPKVNSVVLGIKYRL